MTNPPGTQSRYRRTPLSAEEKARGEANLAPFMAQVLAARGRFRVSADTPDQAELFQGVARRVSEMLQRPVVSYANGREFVITFGQQEPPALALRSPGWLLAEGQLADVTTYLNQDLLVSQWPVLRTLISKTVRAVWESAFPELCEGQPTPVLCQPSCRFRSAAASFRSSPLNLVVEQGENGDIV